MSWYTQNTFFPKVPDFFSLLDFIDFSVWLLTYVYKLLFIQLLTYVYKILENIFVTSPPLTLLEVCKIYYLITSLWVWVLFYSVDRNYACLYCRQGNRCTFLHLIFHSF